MRRNISILFLSGALIITCINFSTFSLEAKSLPIEIKAIDQDNVQIEAKLKKKIENYLKQIGVTSLNDGKRLWAYAVVSDLNINDSNFFRKKITAYEKAYMKALENIAKRLRTRIESEVVRELYRDLSGGKGLNFEEKESPMEVLIRKTLALGDASLNKMLKSLGIDPSKFGKLSFERKKKLAEDLIKRQIAVKTLAELSGVTIVKTVEGIDEKGNYGVGVIVMYSPLLRKIAYAIAHGEKPPLRRGGKDLKDYLPQTTYGWLSAWGSRLVLDSKGFPAIISYGQWAIPVESEKGIWLKYAKESAREKAQMLARAYIADFLNSRFYLEEVSGLGREQKLELVHKIPEGKYRNEKDIIRDIWSKKIKKFSKIDISGINILKERNSLIKIGKNNYIVFVVAAVWNYENYLKSKKIADYEVLESNKTEYLYPSAGKEILENSNSKNSEENILEGPESSAIYDW
jgi:hypothetical protein